MTDTRIHYPNDVLTFDLLPGVWKTTKTMCDVRRNVEYVSSQINDVTCTMCRGCAYEYWTEQIASITSLIRYHESGQISVMTDDISKLNEALTSAQNTIRILEGK